jgi:8-oxo-dGTP pyrophosphatase MutT (NUDIX family)
MAFAADLHVFPGGRVDPGDAEPRLASMSARTTAEAGVALGSNVPDVEALALHHAAIRELWEEAGVLLADPMPGGELPALDDGRRRLLDGSARLADALGSGHVLLRTDRLVPIGHWTTPAFMPRRFSTWFFVADLPNGAEPTFVGGEVVDHVWLTPARALERIERREIEMWVPTTSALERLLEFAASTADELAAQVQLGRIREPRVVVAGEAEIRIESDVAGGLPGRRAVTHVIGRREIVIVDPGDPSDAAIGAILAAVRGGTTAEGERVVRAIVLTATDPDHAGAAEALAIPLEVPILVAPGADRNLPYAVDELSDGALLPCDVPLRVRLDPARSGRREIVPG